MAGSNETPDAAAARAAARVLASQRQRVQGTCAVCGQPTEGTKKRRYCSAACAWRAYYYRTRRPRLLAGKTPAGPENERPAGIGENG